MKLNLLLTLLLIFGLISFSEAQFDFRYGSTYYDVAKKIIPTADGNFIATGMTEGFGSAGNGFLLKVNPNGNIIWVKDYAGINFDEIWDIIELSDRSLVMCGATGSFGSGDWDGFVMKTDSAGNIIFAKAYGSVNTEFFNTIALAGNADGSFEYYVSGYAQDSLHDEGTVLLKLDTLGNILWSKWSSNWDHQGNHFGGEMWIPISLTSTSNGDVILITNISGTGGFDIFKYGSNGTLLWSKRYEPPSGTGYGAMWGYSIIENFQSDLIINFTYANSLTIAHAWDDFVLKLDSLGNFISCKSYGGLYYDIFSSISNTNDGGLLLSGSTNSAGNGDWDAYLIKLDINDSIQWAKAFGGAWADYASNAFQTPDGGYILTGQSWSQGVVNDSSKILIVKTDSSGNSSCNSISWLPLAVNHTMLNGVPLTSSNYSLLINPITWTANNRSFYTSNVCLSLDVSSYNILSDSWNIFPNPSGSKTIIKFKTLQENIIIRISNLLGEEVKRMNVDDYEIAIEKGELNSGIYIVQLIEKNMLASTKKLIIQ